MGFSNIIRIDVLDTGHLQHMRTPHPHLHNLPASSRSLLLESSRRLRWRNTLPCRPFSRIL